MNAVLTAILGYVAVQLAIGFWVSRRIQSEADYLLAGRSLGYPLGIFTIFATWFGAETCIGAAGSIYGKGLAGGTADPFGYAGALFFMGAVFAAALWRQRLTTLADLFRRRYSQGVERFAVLLLVPTSLLWAAAQVRAFGQILAASGDLQVELAITVAAGVVILYTVWGGLLADAITDIIQGSVLIVGLIVLGVVVVASVGGVGAGLASVEPERLRLFGGPDVPWWLTLEAWIIPICGSVLAQELVARVIATRSPRVARNATLGAASLYLLVGLIPVFIGLVGPGLLAGLEDPEQILPRLAQIHLPVWFYVIFAGALVSAILSTVDSALLVAASLVSHNIVLPLRPGASEAQKVRWARTGVIVFGVVAWGLALSAEGVYELVVEASSFGSAGIFVIGTAALFWKRGTPTGAHLALGGGVASWILGAYVFDIATPYLVSLAVAAGGYLLGLGFPAGHSTGPNEAHVADP